MSSTPWIPIVAVILLAPAAFALFRTALVRRAVAETIAREVTDVNTLPV